MPHQIHVDTSRNLSLFESRPAGLTSSLPTMLINWLGCQSKHSFIRPHSHYVRPELGGGTLEGSKRLPVLGTGEGEISMVLGVELSGPILSARRRRGVMSYLNSSPVVSPFQLQLGVLHSQPVCGLQYTYKTKLFCVAYFKTDRMKCVTVSLSAE
jgi:hypothetical protein